MRAILKPSLLLAFALVAEPGLAQDNSQQTVAGAQRFLALQFNNGMIGETEIHPDNGSATFTLKWAIAGSVQSDDPCITKYRSHQLPYDGSQADTVVAVDWHKETAAERDGAAVEFRYVNSDNKAIKRLYFSSVDIATRAAYAIEFIRRSCDGAAGTGF